MSLESGPNVTQNNWSDLHHFQEVFPLYEPLVHLKYLQIKEFKIVRLHTLYFLALKPTG